MNPRPNYRRSHEWPLRLACMALLTCAASPGAERAVIERLLKLARSNPNSGAFRKELYAALGEENIRKGAAVAGNGPDFIWAVESGARPSLYVNEKPFGRMLPIANSHVWFYAGKLPVGDAYRFHYVVNGAIFGGALNIPAYTPDSYAQPGVPQGKLSEKMVHTSKIYAGMQTNYWVYLPAQYNPKAPAPLMIWQDGERLIGRNAEEACVLCPSLTRVLEVTDNLLHKGKIPVMVHLFIQAGTLEGKSMRSIEYDSVTDRYPRFLIEEILPELYAKYNIRRDGYSHAIQGQSSGGICAFNAGWHRPDQFARIATEHGTFTSVAFRNNEPEAGHLFPTWVRREPKRNLRVWVSDGSEDYENEWGSWPLENIDLANSLKLKGYDYRFVFGNTSHHSANWGAKLPDALTWLWRDYDPAKTDQVFAPDPAEKDKPFYRVKIYSR